VLAYASQPEAAVRYAGESARMTHGAPEAIDACRCFAALLLEVEPPRDLHPKIAGLPRDREPPQVRGGGYVVDALEAALWALRSTASFEAAILAAVNLGDDADTTAAIAGQLAGARYGLDGIPRHWRERVHMGEEIVALADALVALSLP
jgi:ADP-ribosyl-[dinitrogen reductase] hydrolase